jgi:predicted PurR-regulated permease PerM
MSGEGGGQANRGVLVLYAASVVLIGAVALPLWKPLVLAAVLASALSGWHDRLAQALGQRRAASAALVTFAVVLVILLPLGGVGFFLVRQALQLIKLVRNTLETRGMTGLLQPLPDRLVVWLEEQYRHLAAEPHVGTGLGVLGNVVGAVSQVAFLAFMMLIALFFLLRSGHDLSGWLRRKSPIPTRYVDTLIAELAAVSRSLIVSNLVSNAAQAVAAGIGYLIAGVPSAALLGILTFFAALVPALGSSLVGVPAIALLVLMGRGWWAVFLAAWMLTIVNPIDNLIRPLFLRRGAELPGSLVFFALIGGLLMFGAMGVVVGPLALVFFLAMSAALREARGGTAVVAD